jgi:hypothetical protein
MLVADVTPHDRAEAIAEMYQPPAVGRPSAIGNIAHVQKFLEHIAAGNYVEPAAHAADLSPVTVYNWKKRGDRGEEPYARFVKAWKEAEAQAEVETVPNIRRASQLPQFWAAGMTLLERRHPERWGRRTDENSGPRVIVNIGLRDSDVQVSIGQMADGSPVPNATRPDRPALRSSRLPPDDSTDE